MQSLYSVPNALPKVSKPDQFNFLLLWSHLQETLQGEARERLNAVARSLNMHLAARKMLAKRNVGQRMLALAILGFLGEKTAWEEIKALAAADNQTLALAAANALAKINPASAVFVIIPLIATRRDWPNNKVVTILNELGPAVISKPLVDAVLEAAPGDKGRLIRFMRFADSAVVLPVIRKMLLNSPADEVVSAGLNILGQFEDHRYIELAKNFLKHPKWYVRVQAVSALGNMGSPGDIDSLVGVLDDREWWVRYRAAQALAGLPLITRERLEKVQSQQNDRYARDILRQVIAEKWVE